MTQEPKITAALIYDFDGTLAPGNMQEYDFIPAVGQSNREFWNDANSLAEEQDADMTLTYMAKMLEAARSRKLSLRREAFLSQQVFVLRTSELAKQRMNTTKARMRSGFSW